ncbi:MAG: hypothetical protein OSJ70_00250 [Bacilli bacterium]|nr:hypothetical protein [Bacilli bacterium]
MDLSEMKKSAKNIVSVTDSISAPLLKLNIKLDQGTVVPNIDDLIIYVDKSATPTEKRKTYTFSLKKKLNYLNSVTDEFIMEPVIEEETIKVKCYVKRSIGDNAILINEEIEMLDLKPIVLFAGINYISTNYSNCLIEIVYPKNNDLVNYFLNSTLFGIVGSKKILSLDDIYFKDCFTKVDAGVNAEFNKTTMKCFNSTNNAFSMDCEGNLVVNTITTKNESSVNSITLSDVYPIGSIYMSVSATNPSTLFGGAWEQLKDRFLLASGTTYKAGATGGAATHTLTANEMPTHTHVQNAHFHKVTSRMNNVDGNNLGSEFGINRGNVVAGGIHYCLSTQGASNDLPNNARVGALPVTAINNNTGGSKAHNNMPPYLTVYMWKRIA